MTAIPAHFRLSSFRRWAAAGALAATLLAAPSAQALDVFPGAKEYTQGLTAADLVVHKMDDEFYTESWYFMAMADNGTKVFIHYGITNAGFGSFTGAVETTVITPDGKIHFTKDSKIDGDDIDYSTEELQIDFDGDHTVEGSPEAGYHITSDGDEIDFDLTYKPVVGGLKFGDGKTYFGEDKEQFYALAIMTPKAKVSGTLTIDGVDEPLKITGYGYADHSWQNYPGHKMADRLFSMRGFSDGSAAAFLAFVTPEGGLIPTLVLSENGKLTLATHKLKIKEQDHRVDPEKDDYLVPGKILIQGEANGRPVKGLIDLTEQIQRQDAVKDFNFFERTMIKMFVARPMLYRDLNSYAFEVSTGADGVHRLEGKGIVETMILRGSEEEPEPNE